MRPQPGQGPQAPSWREPANAIQPHSLREQQEMRQIFARMTPPELVEYALLLLEDTARLRRQLDDARGMIR